MSTSQTATLLRHLRQWAAGRRDDPHSDRELLRRFAAQRDEAAFEALVRRHGPMVLSVCRRILHHTQDAEDAFQATFLVLFRKAGSPFWRDSVGGWLHRVAARIALRLRAGGSGVSPVGLAEEGIVADPLDQLTVRELLAAFDEELARLPESYREPLVLCYLEGKTQEEAAHQLGRSLSTIRRRLERGRKLLHQRLTRRGLELPAAIGAVLLSKEASAVVPAPLRMALTQALNGSASARVAVLAQGVLQAMTAAKLKTMAALVAVFCVLVGGGGLAAHRFLTAKRGTPEHIAAPAATEPDRTPKPPADRRDGHGDSLPRGAIARLGTIRLRREDQSACDFAFTPDGKALVSARNPRVVQFWDVKTGKPLQELRHENTFDTFALSANGKLLATGNRKEIIVWDVLKRKRLRTIAVKDAYESLLIFSPDNETLAGFTLGDRIVHLWDIASGKETRQFAPRKVAFAGMHFFSDGKTLIAAEHSAIRFWDVASGRELRALVPPGTLKCIALSGGDAMLASGGSELVKNTDEGRLVLWDAATGRKLRQLDGHKHTVDAVAFSPDGKMLASAEIGTIYLWDLATGKEVRRIEKSGWHGLAFSPDGKKLASTAPGNETVIRLWDVATGKPIQPAGPDGVVRSVAFSPDGRFVATGCWLGHDSPLRVWDAATGKPLWSGPEPGGYINRVVFTPDGKGLFSSDTKGMVRLWDTKTGETIREYAIPSECRSPVVELSLSPDGQKLTAISQRLTAIVPPRDKAWTVVVWDVQTGKRLLQREGRHPSFSNIASFSADAKILAEPEGKILRLYEVATGQLLLRLETSARWPGQNMEESVAFSPDGRTVATLTSTYVRDKKGNKVPERAIHLWELASGKPSLRIAAGEDRLHAVAFAPDGRTLATGGKGVLQLWDVATGRQLLAYRGQESGVFHGALAFSRDGTRLAAGYLDSTALIWDLRPGLRRLKPRKPLDSRDLSQLWSDFIEADAARAHAAIWTLIAMPDKATRLLKDRLKPIEPVDPRRIRRLVADLDSADFAVRESATTELTRIGEQADPLLRDMLEQKPTLEVRRRIEGLLARPQFPLAGESLRGVRAIQVLEHIGTPETRNVLRRLAKGAPGAQQTREAAAALARLERRSSVSP